MRKAVAFIAAIIMAIAMLLLFVFDAAGNPRLWFGISMILLFTAYSTLTIMFYDQGIAKADALGENGHIQVAQWRESGALVGVCVAAVLPSIFAAMNWLAPMTAFAATFVGIMLFAAFLMRHEWQTSNKEVLPGTNIIGDPILRRLLIIALLNAAPVAVTSNLFLFFVEYRLGSATAAGPFLLLFFLAAAASVPTCFLRPLLNLSSYMPH